MKATPRFLERSFDYIQRSTEGSRLANGLFWSLVGSVSSRGLALISSIVIARVVGKTVFGEFGIIQSTTNMYATFGLLGGLTAVKHVAEFRKTDPERAGRVIALSVLAAAGGGTVMAILMAATSPLAARSLAAPHLQAILATSALALLLSLVNEAQDGVLSGCEAFKRRSAVQIGTAVVSFPATLLGVYLFGLIGIVWALIASQSLQFVLNAWAIRRETRLAAIPIRWRDAPREMGILASFSLPSICSGAVYVPAMWLANMILVNTPSGYAEMGIFNAADRWRTAILFLPSLLGSVTLPMLARLRGESATQRYHDLLTKNTKLSALASFAVALPVALSSPWIMGRFGNGFAEGSGVLVILCLTSVAFAAYWIVGQSLVSRGHVWTMFRFNLGWAVILLTTEWLLRGRGAQGLAMAYLTADAARLAAALFYAHRMRSLEGYRAPGRVASVEPIAG